MKPAKSFESNRREFIAAAMGAATAAAFSGLGAVRGAEEKSGGAAAPNLANLTDTNVYLGRWPFRRLPLDETALLVAKLRDQGVGQAWAGSFDALLHKDITAVNARLTGECIKSGGGLLVPIGALDPMQPDWEEDLRRCVDEHRMPGIRLHPNYHGYKLSDPVFERVLKLADERGLFVQIAVIMEDERTIHPLVNVPPTDTAPLPALAQKFPRVRLHLLNAFRTLRGKPLLELAAAGVRFEIAMLEGVAGVGNLLAQIAPDRLLFGSYAPFFYFESARLKLAESALTAEQMNAVSAGSARQFLAPR
jgi:hypothetical protein